MSLLPLREVLEIANYCGFAVPSFTLRSLDFLPPLVEAAEEENSPLLLQIPFSLVERDRHRILPKLLKTLRELPLPVSVGLEGIRRPEEVLIAAKLGFCYVSLTVSEEVVDTVKKAVSLCVPSGLSLELSLTKERITVKECAELVLKTGVDVLSFPPNVLRKSPGLIKEVKEETNMPLSIIDVPALGYGYGAEVDSPFSEEDVKLAVSFGVNKVGTDQDLQVVFISSLKKSLMEAKSRDLLRILGQALEEVKGIAKRRIRICGSGGRSWSRSW